MRNRRLITAVLLFIVAAASLLVLNRFSSLIQWTSTDSATVDAITERKIPVIEFFDSDTGDKSGELLAEQYTTSADGAIEATSVSLHLAGTDLGDVTMTCSRALLRVESLSSRFDGAVTLSGGVAVSAVRDGVTTLTGLFDEVSYDSASEDVSGAGSFAVSSADGLSISGTGFSGNSASLQLVVDRDVRVSLPDPASDADSFTPLPVVVEAAGSAAFDGKARTAVFSDNVKVTYDDAALVGSRLALGFEDAAASDSSDEDDSSGLSTWRLRSVDFDGPLSGVRADSHLTGDSLLWRADEGFARLTGTPARVSDTNAWIESPDISATFDTRQEVTSIIAAGPGGIFFQPAPDPDPDSAGEAPPVPLAASWTDSLRYDASLATVSLTGDAFVSQGVMHGQASKITVSMEKPAAASGRSDDSDADSSIGEVLASLGGGLIGFEAEGDVSFTGAIITGSGDRASYDKAADTVVLSGFPAIAATEEVEFSSRAFTFKPDSQKLLAERDCRVVIPYVSGADDDAESRGPAVVTGARIDADLVEDTLDARVTGPVRIDWEESTLTCAELTVVATGLSPPEDGSSDDTDASDDKDASMSAEKVTVEGRGDVLFKNRLFSVGGDSFSFDGGKSVLVLRPAENARVEMRYGELANLWTSLVTVDQSASTAVLDKPTAVIFAKGSVAGFQERPRGKSDAYRPKTRIDLTSRRLTLTRPTPELAVLTFEDDVDLTRWDSSFSREDKLTCNRLRLDVAVAPEEGALTDSSRDAETDITAVRASGDVYLKYTGPEDVLESRGTSFEWTKDPRVGRLTGSPARVWMGDSAVSEGTEFIYYFSDDRLVVTGGGAGAFTLQRRLLESEKEP